MARVHAVPAIEQSRRHGVRDVQGDAPLRWLNAGWKDFVRCPWPGLLVWAPRACGSLERSRR